MHVRHEGAAVMAYSLTDTGVRISKGRGANAVALELSFADLTKWAKRMQLDTDALFTKSFGPACSAFKKQLAVIMRGGGGEYGVPKFKNWEDFTREMRSKIRRPFNQMGGVLSDPRRIVSFKRNGAQVIGWPDALCEWALAFQDGTGKANGSNGQADLNSFWWRHRVHKKYGIDDIPRNYVSNPRAVIEPFFHDHVAKNLDEWVHAIYFKKIARKMKESGAVAL